MALSSRYVWIFEAWLGRSKGARESCPDALGPGQRHVFDAPFGLVIPRPVASPQSPAPFHQVPIFYRNPGGTIKLQSAGPQNPAAAPSKSWGEAALSRWAPLGEARGGDWPAPPFHPHAAAAWLSRDRKSTR